jgi:hypothetical protein
MMLKLKPTIGRRRLTLQAVALVQAARPSALVSAAAM